VTFLSTLPARGATALHLCWQDRYGISIHAPREGSDLINAPSSPRFIISIHAPREGSDQRGTAGLGDLVVFLSTLPARGATTAYHDGTKTKARFLSTLPARGATSLQDVHQRCGHVSIHAPREGSDAQPQDESAPGWVSIHAPREG